MPLLKAFLDKAEELGVPALAAYQSWHQHGTATEGAESSVETLISAPDSRGLSPRMLAAAFVLAPEALCQTETTSW